MSKLRIKASHDGKSRLIEVERAGLNLGVVEKAISQSFQLPGVSLKYNNSNGTSTGLYQDFHLENAIKDAETSGARFFELQVSAGSGGSGGSQPAPAPVAAAPKPVAAPVVTAPVSAPAQPATSTCKVCGAKGIAKFCPECGSPNDSFSAPAAAQPAPVQSAPSQPAYQAPAPVAAAPAPKPVQPAYQAPAASRGVPDHKAPPKNLGDGFCASCQGEIGLTSVSALGLSWHKECFVCIGCRKSMVESGFKNVNGWPMCANCYCDSFGLKCAACRKNITADYVQVNGQNYHKECYN